jgi:ubiquinone biosynthesis protein UbiJ
VSTGVQIPDAALAALEGLINRYLALDPEGARRLAALQGRVFLIEVTGFGTPIYLIPGPDSIQLFGEYAGEPDCTLRGSPAALARLGLSRRREDQLFGGEVEVEGQTDLAQELGDLLGGIEVDWEEQLSRLVGDPLAHQVGSGLRSAGRWGRQTTETLTQDLGEYLQEEARLLPSRNEVEAFLDDVDRLRDDVERLAARMGRLAKGHGDGGGEQ